ncbi:MAG: A24 family peptidase [Aromatoleum sp.]|jgi:leader peptidase (prepilin peptidase)/N-methyltransferase|uniref:prepilin peptidase n=1 Tax=Aromatoleum sp. TaxID=2307007 RepID=UPI0028947178|nr:A24 family peptidase [Aromatoleum sp.]MDT3670711.1 A24 family peptidase [Aromatoleum sp.]
MHSLLNDSVVFAVLAAVLGLFVGSFLNVVIHRLPRMMEREWRAQAAELRGEAAPDEETFNLATPRSRCPHCGHQIGALENIPVVSYVALRGRCRHCNATIGGRYPVVELLTAVLSGYAAWHFGFGLAAGGALLFLWAMIALAFIDLDTQLLPDSMTLPLVWLGLAFNLGATYAELPDAVVGAIAGYLSLWSVYWLFKLVTGKEGMGYGDFKLLAAIGAWLGWQMLPLTILFSSLVGAVTGVGLIVVKRHGRNVPIPFGPYLAAAGVIALFWGDSLTALYLGRF